MASGKCKTCLRYEKCQESVSIDIGEDDSGECPGFAFMCVLEKEIEEVLERKKERLEGLPKLVQPVDLTNLTQACTNVLIFIQENNMLSHEHIIKVYKVAMETFYGVDVNAWVTRRLFN